MRNTACPRLALTAGLIIAALCGTALADVPVEVRFSHSAPDGFGAAVNDAHGKIVRGYERATIVQLPPQAVGAFRGKAVKAGWRVIEHPEWQTLYTPRTALPSVDVAARAATLKRPPKGLYVIQFDSPLTADDHALLKRAGANYLAYVPYNGAVVVAPSTIMDLANEPHVTVVSPYDRAYRAQASRPTTQARYIVQLPNIAEAEQTLSAIRTIDPMPNVQLIGPFQNVNAALTPAAFDALLDDPFVIAITPEPQAVLSGEREAIALTNLAQQYSGEPYQDGVQPIKTSSDYRTWLSNRGLSAPQNYRIAIVDSGFDAPPYGGSPPPNGTNIITEHPDFDRTGLLYTGYLGYDGWDYCGHGTLVAGVAAGNPSTAATDGMFHAGMGVAPQAPLFIQTAVNQLCQPDPNMNHLTMANDAYFWGSVVQNHSYNVIANSGQYDNWAQTVDMAVRDTYGNDGNDTSMPMTVAAGNIQPGLSGTMVGSPATAKNVITVGATESYRPGVNGPCDIGTTESARNDPQDFWAASFGNVAYLSRRGTTDGRIKPDIVAPSTLISSTRTRTYIQGDVYGKQRGDLFCLDHLLPMDANGDGLYTVDSGTSFAAPQAAGACVLLDRQRGTRLSPAMLKAALVGNALSVKTGIDRRTGSSVGARPNAVQGFGRLYLGDAFSGQITQTYLDESSWTPFTSAGQYRSRTFTIPNTSRETVIVLAWTDEYANVNANPTLVRDLDAEVIVDGCTSYTGNKMTTGEVSRAQVDSSCGGAGITYDNLNNVEMIVIPSGRMSTFNLDIYSSTWGSGGHVQNFAVFASNAY